MRQKISHGADINVATPDEVQALIQADRDRANVVEYRRLKGTCILNAAGAALSNSAQSTAGGSPNNDLTIPSQFDFLLERAVFGGAGLLATTTIGVYENQVSDTDLLDWELVGAGLKYAEGYSNRIYVTANSTIIIAWTGGTANLQVTYNLQGRLVRAGGMMSRSTR
jgi:hypothetical protein